MTGPLTPVQRDAELKRLAADTKAHRDAQAAADAKLAKRDQRAARLADHGVRYVDLAAAMGITVDGVTYVLRKMRRAPKS